MTATRQWKGAIESDVAVFWCEVEVKQKPDEKLTKKIKILFSLSWNSLSFEKVAFEGRPSDVTKVSEDSSHKYIQSDPHVR